MDEVLKNAGYGRELCMMYTGFVCLRGCKKCVFMCVNVLFYEDDGDV